MGIIKKDALVIGSGIAGMSTALELANNGLEVNLLEREAAIGGLSAGYACKATDSCSACSVCLVGTKMSEVTSHPRITTWPGSEITGISGNAGNFIVSAWQKPQYVIAEKCTGCGVCAGLCPANPKAVYEPNPQAAPGRYVIDSALCLRFKGKQCNLCQENCPPGAIDFKARPQKQMLKAGAIVIASGVSVFNAQEVGGLGYGLYPNVITGYDLEGIVARNGVSRLLGDGVKRVAFIQCVGSRNKQRSYCSQACCKYAIRFASLFKYQKPETEVTVFYIDLQTAGKGFYDFYQKSKNSIEFVRGIPVEITAENSNLKGSPGGLVLKFEDIAGGKVKRRAFDLAVLSVGMLPNSDNWDLARLLGVNLAEDGFFEAGSTETNETNVAGVLLAGGCQGPKDIADSIAHGVAAAKGVMEVLARCK